MFFIYIYFRYTVDEAIELITADDFDEVGDVNLYFMPPVEDPHTLTDEDSDRSDDEVTADFNHLPGRILREPCEIQIRTDTQVRDIIPDNVEQSPIRPTSSSSATAAAKQRVRKHDRNWSNIEADINSFPTKILPQKIPTDLRDFHTMRASIDKPIDAFNVMFCSSFYDVLIEQSNLYAIQHHSQLSIDEDELRVFVGVCLLSGYCPVPNRRMYWSTDMDVNNPLVSSAIRRDRFDEIMRNLHFANNMLINDDPFYKVRPLFNIFNKTAKLLPPDIELSVDETMVEYFGRHGCKQRIQMKPIRSGFKIWNLAGSTGVVVHSEPYCGHHTQLPDFGIGHGGNVVLGLLQKADIGQGHKVFFDNYFTTFSLAEELTKQGIGAVGTIQEKYLGNITLPAKKAFAKTVRGTFSTVCSSDLLVVRWNDNKPVTVVTNFAALEPLVPVKRYSSVEKRSISVNMPGPLSQYNRYMGGVDVFDQSFNAYKVRVRSKKWWWPLFVYILNASTINAWRLYVSVRGPIGLLQFTREVASLLIRVNGTMRRKGRLSLIGSAGDAARKDGKDHWPIDSDVINGVCPICRKRTKVRCEKCDVALHVRCFKLYHVNAPV